MCRLLCVRAAQTFSAAQHLSVFAHIAKNSTEYQGHGWGCAYLKDGVWQLYTNIKPIWEDDLNQFGDTTVLLAHARSAFRDKGIYVENNMPFFDGKFVFIFNGELRGVKIKAEGRIGAEKIFNYIKRFYKGDMEAAIRKGVALIKKRAQYVRAMNFMIADAEHIYLCTFFNQEPEYFQLHTKKKTAHIICSAPYPEEAWEKIPNDTIEVFS